MGVGDERVDCVTSTILTKRNFETAFLIFNKNEKKIEKMSFKRGSSFSNFNHQFQAEPELEELEDQRQKQYFGFQKQRGLMRQNPADFNNRGRGRDCRDDIPNGSMVRVKPGKEVYRPPTGTWNPEAQEFKPLSPAPLTMSRSMDLGMTVTVKPDVKSGSRHVETVNSELDIRKLGVFGKEMEAIIAQSLEDPNSLSARSHMELVRQIFTKVVESQKISELAARLCIYIIERERKETFLESLLNTCQEWYHERDRIIRSEAGRWAAFMSFLNELYGLLKRKQKRLGGMKSQYYDMIH